MPPVITWAAAYVYTAFAAVGWSGAAAWATAVAVTTTAGMYALNAASAALMPGKPRQKGGGLQLNYSGTNEPRRLIYGEVKVGGMQTIPPIATAKDGNHLHFVLTLAGHECESLTDVYFDDTMIASANIAAVTGVDGDGLVTGGTFKDYAWLRRYTGTASQTADYILTQAFAAAFDADFRGRGIAYLAVRLRYGPKRYGGGVPTITVKVKGKKCYDPRTATTIWSDNPAVCVRDFLVTEMGFDSTQIDDTLVQAAANVCDQLVNIPGATTEKRYTLNTVLSAAENWESNLKTLIDAMSGRVVYRDGKWRIYAGTWEVPSITILRADWVSACQMQASQSREERWNAVRAFYVDRSRNYERNEAYIRTNATYQTADNNERIFLELELPAVTGDYQAQRIAESTLRRSRNQLKIAGRLRPEFAKLSPWDTVYVTDEDFGWTLKTFRVVSMTVTPEGAVDVALVEEGDPTWTDLAAADYNAPSDAFTIDPSGSMGGPFIVDPYMREGDAWWRVASGSQASCVSYNPTGGLNTDGSIVLTNASSTGGFAPAISNVRSPYFQWIPGEWWRIVGRFRRVNAMTWAVTPSVASLGLSPVIEYSMLAHKDTGAAPFAFYTLQTNSPVTWDSFQAKDTDDWFELATDFQTPLVVTSKAYWLSKYMTLTAYMSLYGSEINSGAAIEIDALDAYRISGPGGGASVTYATAPEVRSATATGLVINPLIAGSELSRLFAPNLYGGGNATTQVNLGDISGTVCLDCRSSNVFSARLVGNVTLVASNPMDGQFVNFRVKQNGAGGKTITYASYINVASGHSIASGADKKSHIGMFWDSVDSEFTASIGKGW